MRFCRRCGSLTIALGVLLMTGARGAETWPKGLKRVREQAGPPFVLAEDGKAAAGVVVLTDGELVRNAADWLTGFVRRSTGARVPVGGAERLRGAGRHVVAAVGDGAPLIKRLAAAGGLHLEPRVGPQGFVLERVSDAKAGELLVCWSPTELGCRYGLLQVLRSLQVAGRSVHTPLGRVVERPQFPYRICYVNFAQHLQNAYNPNLLFDAPTGRWTRQDWERFIDMISAFRFNVFEFWLVPTLFSPEALKGGKLQADFAETMNHVIGYAKRRGVAVHPIQAVNCVGRGWHYHCPKDPKEHAEIVALWDYWSRTLRGNDYIGFFPGDPGGCTRNGCTAETFVDLCLELSKVVRKNNPGVTVEIGTWGSPFAGWGVQLWHGKPPRARRSMDYLLAKLPEFPKGTLVSINQGFSPDCHPSHGGSGKPFARRAAQTNAVLTWDYSVTEGEGTVLPHCRVRRMFARRREELALGCYSGGICYTMAPKLNCLSLFACAEAYWNPALEPDAVLADYGRLVFGDALAAIGPLLEELEVIPDWGYYAPFPYSPQRLQKSMARLLPLLEKADPKAEPRLPLAPTMAEHRHSYLFFADLFGQCATFAAALEEAAKLAKAAGRAPKSRKELLSLDEIEQLAAAPDDFPQKARLRTLAAEIRAIDVRKLRRSYWDTVYGIYDKAGQIQSPRAQGATTTLFRRFHYDYAIAHEPSALEQALRATAKPYLLCDLGTTTGERGWTLSGWSGAAEYEGETWRASFDKPGLITRGDFGDRGCRWLAVRLTEGPKGGRKTVAVNGKQIARFVRTGPPVKVKKEWWVTRSYPIPEGLLKSGKLEIRFTDPGVAIAGVALSAERVPDANQ